MRDPFRQTSPLTPYPAAAVTLADELEAVMAEGTYDLPGIVAALNARAGGPPWTEETLRTELAALANA